MCEFDKLDKTFASDLYRSSSARVCISDKDQLLMFYLSHKTDFHCNWTELAWERLLYVMQSSLNPASWSRYCKNSLETNCIRTCQIHHKIWRLQHLTAHWFPNVQLALFELILFGIYGIYVLIIKKTGTKIGLRILDLYF